MAVTSEKVKSELNEKTVIYLRRTLQVLPFSVISLDSSKILLAYFGVAGLDVLNRLDKLPNDSQSIIEWIYKHQITQPNQISTSGHNGFCGFRGSMTLTTTKTDTHIQCHDYDCSHLTMTFSALNTLLTLGDDLSRINKEAILTSIRALQLPDGSFSATFDGGENDVRFLYSACCICYILNDWSYFDKEKATNYLLRCLSYEGAFGQSPGSEAHGGSTYCSVASLHIMDKLDSLNETQTEKLVNWCLNRQTTGFSGRVNKPWDTCYSFWIGSTLKILNALKYSNYAENINYVYETCNSITGGFSKWPDCSADPLHTFMALCGLSLVTDHFSPVHPALIISMKAYAHLKQIHARQATL